MKFQLGQEIWYRYNGEICSGGVVSRACIENAHDEFGNTKAQREAFQSLGPGGVYYVTFHGTFREENCFATKDEVK